jgi:hypothetical protein
VKTAAKALVSVAIGALLAPCLVMCWATLAAAGWAGWLILPATRMGIHGAALHAAVAPLDFMVTVAFTLPAAWILWRLGKEHLALHVGLAVASLAITDHFALGGLTGIGFGFWNTLSGLLFYAALPVAVCLVAALARMRNEGAHPPVLGRGAR